MAETSGPFGPSLRIFIRALLTMLGIGQCADGQEMVAAPAGFKPDRALQWYRLSGLN